MRSLILAPLLALSLLACDPGAIASNGTIPASAQVANHTMADEAVMKSAEESYKLLRTAIEIATDAKVIKGQNAITAAAVDNKAYQTLLAIRSAYAAFNSADLASAAHNLADLVHQGAALLKGNPA